MSNQLTPLRPRRTGREQRTLYGDVNDASTMVEPADERGWQWAWTPRYRTKNQPADFRILPLRHSRRRVHHLQPGEVRPDRPGRFA